MAKKPVNERLLILAKAKGLTQASIAHAAGMQPSHVNRYFNGVNDLTSGHFIQILKAVGIDIEKLLAQELQNLAGVAETEISDINSSAIYLLNSIDDLGKQTMLMQLLWAAKLAKGGSFPKHIENKIKKEISLI